MWFFAVIIFFFPFGFEKREEGRKCIVPRLMEEVESDCGGNFLIDIISCIENFVTKKKSLK